MKKVYYLFTLLIFLISFNLLADEFEFQKCSSGIDLQDCGPKKINISLDKLLLLNKDNLTIFSGSAEHDYSFYRCFPLPFINLYDSKFSRSLGLLSYLHGLPDVCDAIIDIKNVDKIRWCAYNHRQGEKDYIESLNGISYSKSIDRVIDERKNCIKEKKFEWLLPTNPINFDELRTTLKNDFLNNFNFYDVNKSEKILYCRDKLSGFVFAKNLIKNGNCEANSYKVTKLQYCAFWKKNEPISNNIELICGITKTQIVENDQVNKEQKIESIKPISKPEF